MMAHPDKLRRFGRRFIMADHVLSVIGFFVVFPLISLHFVDHLGWAAASVGLALALRQFCQQGLGLIGGTLADRFGARPLIITGMIWRAGGFALLANASNHWWLFAACILSGLGGALFDPPRAALIIKLTRVPERNRFYTLLMMQESAGAVFGALLGSWLFHFDFWWVGMGGCAIFLTAALLNYLLLPDYRLSPSKQTLLENAANVLQDRSYMKLVLILSGYYIMLVQIMLLIPITLKQMSGSAMTVSWLFTMETILTLLLMYPLAQLGEKYLAQTQRILIGIVLITLSLLAMCWITQTWMAFVVLAVFYLGNIIVEPAREAYLASLAKPHAKASYMGMSRIGLAIGGAVGYTGGGWLLDVARSQQQPWLPWLTLAVIGAITCFMLLRHCFQLPGQAPQAALAAS